MTGTKGAKGTTSGSRIGLIARADNKGLAAETHAIYENIAPSKVLVVDTGCGPLRKGIYDPARTVIAKSLTDEVLDRWLVDLDVVLTCETPYNWRLFEIARARGVRSVLKVNYEYLPDPMPSKPDLIWMPIDWHLDDVRALGIPVAFIPIPVDRRRFPFRLRERATTFLAVLGRHTHGESDRNGVRTILQAIPLVKSREAKFLLRSIDPLPETTGRSNSARDPRVRVVIADQKMPDGNYVEGDVLLHPRRYAGTSLPMNEGLSCGLPVIMTDMSPQDRILPSHWFVATKSVSTIKIARPVEFATVDPAELARNIDEWAGRDIAADSRLASQIAEEMSWERLGPAIREMLGATPKTASRRLYFVPESLHREPASGYSIAYCGNFKHPHCTEVHVARSLEQLGHRVKRIQEDAHDARAVSDLSASSDLFLYTRTWGIRPHGLFDGMRMLEEMRARGTATAALHLDLYLGLHRDSDVRSDNPFWATDLVFTADGGLEHAAEFASRGIRHVHLSPAIVADECKIGRWKYEWSHDVIFVGTCKGYHGEWSYRSRLLSALRERYGKRFVTFGPGGDVPHVRNADLNNLYASAAVVVGDSLYSPNYWSDRYFETIGRGGFLVAPMVDGLEKYLVPGVHYIGFDYDRGRLSDFSGLFNLVDYFLDHEAERELIRRSGFTHVRSTQTYLHRMSEMIRRLDSDGLLRDRRDRKSA